MQIEGRGWPEDRVGSFRQNFGKILPNGAKASPANAFRTRSERVQNAFRTRSELNVIRFREKQNCQPPFRYIRFYLPSAMQCHVRASAQCGLSCDYFQENSNVERNFVKSSLSQLQLNSENNLKNAFRNPFTGLSGVR